MSIKNLNTSMVRQSVSRDIVVSSAAELAKKAFRGIYYVSQDNYVFATCDQNTGLTFYADSATSCIIVIVKGQNAEGKEMIGMSHLSRTARFHDFFAMAEEVFQGDVVVYASGANPAEPIQTKGGLDYTALRNTDTLRGWLNQHAFNPEEEGELSNPRIVGNMIREGIGNPSDYDSNLDCLGYHTLNGGVSFDRQWLADAERDETGGLQTLYCIYGEQGMVRPQAVDFTDEEAAALIQNAKDQDFERAADMTDEEILETFSSTPNYEVPWFCDTIRASAIYVKNAG